MPSAINYKILIIEKKNELRELIAKTLQENPNYLVYTESNAPKALRKLQDFIPDMVVLNSDLDEVSGTSLCRQIRDIDIKIRILMLGDPNGGHGAVECLAKGADDYVPLPLDIEELKARAEARLRYKDELVDPIITCNDIKLNNETFEVFVKDKKIDLTMREFEILKLLLQNKNRIISRDKILNTVWGYLYEVEPRAVDIQISKLRRKISYKENAIISVRGFGYKIEEKA